MTFKTKEKVKIGNGKEATILAITKNLRNLIFKVGYWIEDEYMIIDLPECEISKLKEKIKKEKVIGFKKEKDV